MYNVYNRIVYANKHNIELEANRINQKMLLLFTKLKFHLHINQN